MQQSTAHEHTNDHDDETLATIERDATKIAHANGVWEMIALLTLREAFSSEAAVGHAYTC